MVIEGDFVSKGVEKFNCLSQDLDLEDKKYLVLLFQEQLVLVVLVEERGSNRDKKGRNPGFFCKN
jgi:hypothetical protein